MKNNKRLYTRLILLIILFFTIFGNYGLFAQNKNPETLLELNQTPVFGFSPSIKLTYPINEKISFVPYIEYWFQNASSDTLGDIYPGLELGVGIKFSFLQEKLKILTSFGIYSGNSHSGGGRFVLLDAIVPMVTVDYSFAENWKCNFSSRAWIQGRLMSYLRYRYDDYEISANVDYLINQRINVGLFFDQLIFNQKSYNTGNVTYTGYFALGPTLTLRTNNVDLFLGYGVDLVDFIDKGIANNDKIVREFYKVKASFKL